MTASGAFLAEKALDAGSVIDPGKASDAVFSWTETEECYLAFSCAGETAIISVAPVLPEVPEEEIPVNATHRVTFDGNGGMVAVGHIDVEHGESVSLASYSSMVSRSGYTHLGWDTSSGVTSPTYGSAGVYGPVDSEVTLYAIWKDTTLPVISDVQINAGNPYTMDYRVTVAVTIDADPSGIGKVTFAGSPSVDISSVTVTYDTGAPVSGTIVGSSTYYLSPSVTGPVKLVFSDVVFDPTDGSKGVSVKVTDGAGNDSASLADSIVLDMTPPVITSVSGNSSTGSFTAAITETGSGVSKLIYAKSGEYDTQYQSFLILSYGIEVTVSSSPWTLSPSAILSSSKYDWVKVIAVDTAGNASSTRYVRRFYASGIYSSFYVEP